MIIEINLIRIYKDRRNNLNILNVIYESYSILKRDFIGFYLDLCKPHC